MRTALAALSALLLASACIESEEEIEVRSDGSLAVSVKCTGGASDLATGFALPLGQPWTLAENSPGVALSSALGRAPRLVAVEGVTEPENKSRATARAHFASAAELPRFYAPADEPYRDAYLARDTRLSISTSGGRTVYVFERTFGARTWGERYALAGLEKRLPEDIQETLRESADFSDAQWDVLAPIVTEEYEKSALSFARDALVSTYTLGDASLPTAVLQSTLDALRRDLRSTLDEARLRRMYAALREEDADFEHDPDVNPDLLVRGLLRDGIARELSAAQVPETTRNSILGRLEWSFTAFDATADLQDESFSVHVTLPGTVIDGNFAELEGSRASWEFDGEELADKPVVLRAVSVVE